MPNKIQIIALALVAVGAIFYWPSKPNEFGLRALGNNEKVSVYIKSQMGICYLIDGRNKCYQAVADLFMDQFDYQTILAEFSMGEKFPEVFARCHEATHYIGRQAYLKERSIPVLFANGTSSCWGGFYHGVMEGYFDSKNLSITRTKPELLTKEIKNVCGQKRDYQLPRAYNECIHGIGHALMFISDMDLPSSLAWCDKLAGQGLKDTCYGGIFMENSSSSTNLDHPTKYMKADDPFYPCNTLAERYLTVCYEYQSSYFARLSNWDWIKNAELCAQIPERYQIACFQMIGSNQVGSTSETKAMHKTCGSMPNFTVQRDCIIGVISGLAGRYVGEPAKMIEFCNLAAQQFKEDCWIAIGRSSSDWAAKKNQPSLICATDNPNLADLCRKAYNNLIQLK